MSTAESFVWVAFMAPIIVMLWALAVGFLLLLWKLAKS